jgi:hypothetical protein
MAPASTPIAYHAGRCAVCDRLAEGTRNAQEVRLHVLGWAGTVTLRCWLCPACQPTPTTVSGTSARPLQRVLGWYRSTPSAWPTLLLARDA